MCVCFVCCVCACVLCARAHGCVYMRICVCICVRSPSPHFSLSVLDHLLPQVIHSLKNQSLDVLRLALSLKSPSTVELFRALPQSRLKEFQFAPSDRQMV